MKDAIWTRIEPVPGRSAHQHFVTLMACVVGGSALVGVSILVQLATRAGFSQLLPNLLLATICALVPISFLFVRLLKNRTAEERSAGYTTSVMGWTDLPQIDHRTGIVIRAAGQPLLNFEQKKEQARRVESYRRSSPPEYRGTP